MRCPKWLMARSIQLIVVLAALVLALEPGALAVRQSDFVKQVPAIAATSAAMQTSGTASQPRSCT
jgi:hypothetical protein